MKILSSLATLFLAVQLNAQTDHEAIKNCINSLFTAIATGDSTLAAGLFAPQARLNSLQNRNNQTVLTHEELNSFLTLIADKKPDQVFDERVKDIELRQDQQLATAWVPYQFFYNGAFSHCGVNAFQLVKLNNNWKILQITDTRRKNCD